MSEQPNSLSLSEALNESIERLAAGQSITDCLQAFPQFADELRTLLLVGSSVRQLDYQDKYTNSAYQNIRQRLEIQSKTRRMPRWQRPGGITSLVASLLIIFIAVFIFLSVNDQPKDGEQATQLPATAIVTPTGTATLEISTPSATVSVTATTTLTESPVTTSTITVTASPSPNAVLPGLTISTATSPPASEVSAATETPSPTIAVTTSVPNTPESATASPNETEVEDKHDETEEAETEEPEHDSD